MHSNDALGAAAELGASQHGAVTRTQATRIGLSSRQIHQLIAAKVLREPIPGVLVFTSVPVTPRQTLWLATHACGGGFLASHESAAWLHGLDGFDAPPAPEVIGARGRRIAGIPGLVQHVGDVARDDRFVIDGIPCVGLARTVCDIGSKLGPDPCLRAIDSFERSGHSLLWLARTSDRLQRPGQAGTLIVKALLAKRSGRAPDTWFERLVERCVVIPGLPPWTRQHEVRDDDGGFVGRIDLACAELRIGVEAHSKRFHFGAGPGLDDQERDDAMAAVGWDLRYVGWLATKRTPEQVARRVEVVARRRAADLGVRLPWVA